jgi:hypothetical protein
MKIAVFSLKLKNDELVFQDLLRISSLDTSDVV